MLYKNTFSTEHLQTTASNTDSEFLQKDIDKCKECQTSKSTKKIHLREEKKESMEQRETNSNDSY